MRFAEKGQVLTGLNPHGRVLMKLSRTVLIIMLCLCMLFVCSGCRKRTSYFSLEYQFTSGQLRYVKVKTESTLSSKPNDSVQIAPIKTNWLSTARVETVILNPKGEAILKIVMVDANAKSDQINLSFEQAQNPIPSWMLMVDPKGRIITKSKKVKTANPVHKMLAYGAMTNAAIAYAVPLPKKPVKVGDTWRAETITPFQMPEEAMVNPNNLRMKTTCTLIGLVDYKGAPSYCIRVNKEFSTSQAKKEFIVRDTIGMACKGYETTDFWLSQDKLEPLAFQSKSEIHTQVIAGPKYMQNSQSNKLIIRTTQAEISSIPLTLTPK